MCISNRLKQVLEAKNMTVTEFSNVTGISYRSAMNYLNEGRDPNVEALVKIHHALGVSITWLVTGDSSMPEKTSSGYSLTTQEISLIKYYRSMPLGLRNSLCNFIQNIINQYGEKDEDE